MSTDDEHESLKEQTERLELLLKFLNDHPEERRARIHSAWMSFKDRNAPMTILEIDPKRYHMFRMLWDSYNKSEELEIDDNGASNYPRLLAFTYYIDCRDNLKFGTTRKKFVNQGLPLSRGFNEEFESI